jgi:hypothetical protein
LQVARLGLGAVIARERAVDIDRVGAVPFDEVAVVAAHRAHQGADAVLENGGEPAAEGGGFGDEGGGQVGELALVVLGKERLHGRDGGHSCRFLCRP